MIVLTTFIHHLPGGLHGIVFEGHFPCLLPDPDAGLLLATAASKLADIINCRLQGPMILADDIRIVLAHTNRHCRTGMQFVLGILAIRLVSKADSDRQGDPPSKARKKRFHRRSLPQIKGQLLGQSRSIIHPHPNAETTNDRPRLL